ncbi:MAG: WYL domain-containing protein [Spirochaetales bacterium]|nr:WYL domain-containing protein [Spirochaetales bacterium]
MSNLHRIQWIDAALRDNRFPNCTSIAAEFGISPRQAARDVEYLKYSLGAPVEYSFGKRGYYYSENTFILPAYFIGEEERDALLYLADRYRSAGGDATVGLASFFDKLRAGGSEAGRPPASGVPVYHLKAGQVKIYGLMKEAAAARRKVRIAYRDVGNRKSGRVIRPYVVFIKDKADYVHAYCETRNAERDFRLDRIAEPELLNERFEVPASFDPRLYTADFRFDFRLPYRVLVALDSPPPPECPLSLIPAGDGVYEVEFSSSLELFRKLVSVSSGFTVVHPLWLRRKCREFFAGIAEKNG